MKHLWTIDHTRQGIVCVKCGGLWWKDEKKPCVEWWIVKQMKGDTSESADSASNGR